jgi:hypothetical protein
MIHIKRFIDKVSHVDGRQGKDVVLPAAEARGLRDELSKLLADNCELLSGKLTASAQEQTIQVEIVGGKF